jgi:hypothetical protein
VLRNYLRIAARILARNKLYTIINVLGLALGICGCIIIWLVGRYELSFDRFHPGGDRIYRVVGSAKTPDFQWAVTLPPMPAAMRQQIPGLDAVTTCFDFTESHRVKVPGVGTPDRVFQPHMEHQPDFVTGIAIVDPDWFRVFHYQWLAGNPATALTHPFTVVLTERALKQYFGNLAPADALGKELIYADSLHAHVTGVVSDWTGHSDLAFTDLVSLSTIAASFLKENHRLNDWTPHMGPDRALPSCYVKLNRDIAPGQVETSMNGILARQVVTDPKHPVQEVLQPLTDIHFNHDYRDNSRHKAHLPTLYALTAIALFILFLATVNFINLSTAQSLQRAKEIGVRKVLGSGRRGLVLQFLTETGVLTAVAVVIAGLLVWPVMRYFHDYIPEGVRFDPLAPGTWLFLTALTTGVTVLAGFYPARVLSGYQPV